MNAVLRVLKLPWSASSGSSRWIVAFTLLLVLAVVVPAAKLYRGPGWVTVCAALCVFAIGVLWLLVIPNALWLARDARNLRLPAITRLANASPWAYALLSVIAPALLLGAAGGHTLLLLALFTLVAAGCLAYVLLPATLASVLFLAGVLIGNFLPARFMPATGDPLFTSVSMAALAVIVLATWRWRHLLRAAALDSGVWGRPVAWQYRLIREQGYFNALRSARDAQRAGLWEWLRPKPDLHGMGPGRPVRTIRMALGRATMPQTWARLCASWALGLVALAMCLALALYAGRSPRDLLALLASPPLIGGIFGAAAGTALISCVGQIQGRWSGTAAELPLLALLPGLGAATALRRRVVLACLLKPVRILLAALFAVWAIGSLQHSSASFSLVALMFVGTCVALAAALVLGALGGKPVPGWMMILAAIALVLLLGFSFGLADQADNPVRHASFGWLVLALSWLAALAWFGALAWRGGRALQRRPHPFLTP